MRTSRQMAVVAASMTMALALCGCQSDEIQSYQVPKPEQPKQTKVDLRLLVAMFQPGDRTWFIKLMGPAQQVGEDKETFDRFIQSVHFTDQPGKPITWTVPEGWREEGASAMRHATFRLKDSLDVSVVALGREAGSLLANINRWRGQIGLAPVTETELSQVTKETKINGVSATLVDMSGQGSSTAPKMPPFASGRGPAGGPKGASGRPAALKYQTPAGWKEQGAGGMSVATFQVSEGDQSAEVTVSPLAGPAGGVLANINRWRGQIGLDAVGEDQANKDINQIQVAGQPARYIDLVGPESAGRGRQRILAVLVSRGEETWFFKMRGPADLVGKQKSAFEAFVDSVRFQEGAGANDG